MSLDPASLMMYASAAQGGYKAAKNLVQPAGGQQQALSDPAAQSRAQGTQMESRGAAMPPPVQAQGAPANIPGLDINHLMALLTALHGGQRGR